VTAFVFRSYICVHVCASATLCSKLLQSEILVASTVLGRAHWHATGNYGIRTSSPPWASAALCCSSVFRVTLAALPQSLDP